MRRRILPKGTSWFFLLFMLACRLPGGPAFCQTFEDAVKRFQAGRLDEAKRMLVNLATENADHPEALFYLGKVEEKGELSAEYLESISSRCPDWAESAEAELLLCKYDFCRGTNVGAVERARKFGASVAQSELMPNILWVSGCSFLALNQPDSARLHFEQILRSFPGSDLAEWAQLGRGDCYFASQAYPQAVVEYNKVLDLYRYSQAFPFALSGLAQSFTRLKDAERALLYQNLLKERYPLSVESASRPIQAEMAAEGRGKEGQAERLAGIRYAIQLGVFGQKQNALNLRSQFEEQGYSVRVKAKIIGGKKYSVVQLGSFVSYQEALELKGKLESQTGENYSIVIR